MRNSAGWILGGSVALASILMILGTAAYAQIPGRSVNMVAGTDWPGGDPFLQRQNEPTCAVSSASPWRILCAANDYRTVDLPGLPDGGVIGDAWLGVFLSFDGGNRWQSTLLPGFPQDRSPEALRSPLWGFEAAADPVVRSAHNRLFYLSGMVFDRGEDEPAATFVARFIDLNNQEGTAFDIVGNSAPIRYLGARRTYLSTAGSFADKPWLAVDVPRPGARNCRIRVPQQDGPPIIQRFPGGNVYQSFSVFRDAPAGTLARLMFTRSTNCGRTWSYPHRISGFHRINQGSTIGIDPTSGDVYVAWRRFAFRRQKDAILIAKSEDGGRHFTRPIKVAEIDPFEQGTSLISFRTTMFPTMAVDADGRVHLAWSERVGPEGDGRIVISTSTDGGFNWSLPQPVDNPMDRRGHQFMPSLLFHQGELQVLYYEQSLDHTYGTLVCPGTCTDISEFVEAREPAGDLADGLWWKVFNQCLVEVAPTDPACDLGMGWDSLERRHTLDVFVARAQPSPAPIFDLPVQVSSYPYGSRPESELVEQLQFNTPNLPLFQLGSASFIGDYIDLIGAPSVIPDGDGGWSPNIEPDDAWLGYGVWTSNRDVRPPPDGDWTTYTPPFFADDGASLFDPTAERPACEPGRAGMRNQNIYMTRITDGLMAGAMQNSKPLGMIPNPDPDPGEPPMIPIQRTFVIVVQNATAETRHFRLTIQDPDPGVEASFLQFEPLAELEVSLAPKSSASRSVFVISPNDPAASVTVLVQEIPDVSGGLPPIAGGLRDSIVLNPDPTAPDITNPDITNPDITNPDITNAEVYNPDITNPDITNPDITNPDITNPDITNPDITNPDIINPDITNPDVTNPDITNPDITNPDITNPDITNPDIVNGAITDATWTVTNNGNTSMAFDVNLLLAGRVPAGFKLQMILHKIYSTPVVLGCELMEETHNLLVASIPRPVFVTDPSQIGEIDPTNPDITNATLHLAPAEIGKITLRIVDPDRFDDETAEEFLQDNAVAPVVVSQSVDTEDAADALFEGAPPPPPPATAPVTILTSVPPPAVLGLPYGLTVQALGGEPPYLWSTAAGSLPPGLGLNSVTGLISGTPSAPGTYPFTMQVMDSATPADIDIQSMQLDVTAPDLVVDGLTHDPSSPTTVDLISFTAVVGNSGNGPAPPSTLMFAIGDETPGSVQTLFAIPALAAGQTHEVGRQATLAVAQSYTNTAETDYEDDVIESNEGNNLATDIYSVILPGSPLQAYIECQSPNGGFSVDGGAFTTLVQGEAVWVDVRAEGSTASLWSCGWPSGCLDLDYTIFPGEHWTIVVEDPAPRIVMQKASSFAPLNLEGIYTEPHDLLDDGNRGFFEYYETATISHAGVPFGVKIDGVNTVSSTLSGTETFTFPVGGLPTKGIYLLGAGTYLGTPMGHKAGYCDDPTHLWFELHYSDGSQESLFPTDHITGLNRWADILNGDGAVQTFTASPVGFVHLYRLDSNPAKLLDRVVFQDNHPIGDYTVLAATLEAVSVEPPGTSGYWRFEEGSPDAQALGTDSVLDSSVEVSHGDPFGGPIYRDDVPIGSIPLTGVSNSLSLEFDGLDDEVVFDSLFPFHGPSDATIEFWLNIVGAGHRALFWTRSDDVDNNRFNIYVQDGHFGFDYRSPGGVRHVLIDHVPGDMEWIGYDTWAHVAIARSGNEYRLYVDGALRRTVVDVSPDLPTSGGWQIAGRDGYHFQGKVDELRFADSALEPLETLLNRSSIRIKALIDGISRLTVDANAAQWHHLVGIAPGRATAVDEPTAINGTDWSPIWPDVPDRENDSCDCDSGVFAAVVPPLPSTGWTATLREIAVRDSVSVVEQPTTANGYKLVLEFSDDLTAGAEWYTVEFDLPTP